MLRKKRNCLQIDNWILNQIDPDRHAEILATFDCGDHDLNEYFQKDALLNKAALFASLTICLKHHQNPFLLPL